jgi:hypothetical protein
MDHNPRRFLKEFDQAGSGGDDNGPAGITGQNI